VLQLPLVSQLTPTSRSYVWNIVRIKYRYMMEVVHSHQQEAESAAADLIARLQSSPDHLDAVEETHALAGRVLNVWSQLPDQLILKFADGYNTPTYPDWWLKAVGYEQGPPPSL
jgi:dipeptidase